MNDIEAIMLSLTNQQSTAESGPTGICGYLADLLRSALQVGMTDNQTRITEASTRRTKALTDNNQAKLQDYLGQIRGRAELLTAAGSLLDAEQQYTLKLLRKMLPPDQYRAVLEEAANTSRGEAQYHAIQSLSRAFQADKIPPQQLIGILNANQQRPPVGVVEAAPSDADIHAMTDQIYAQLRSLSPHDQELKLAQIAEGLESRFSPDLALTVVTRVRAMLNGTTARPGF